MLGRKMRSGQVPGSGYCARAAGDRPDRGLRPCRAPSSIRNTGISDKADSDHRHAQRRPVGRRALHAHVQQRRQKAWAGSRPPACPQKPTSVCRPKLALKRAFRSFSVEFSIINGEPLTIHSDWETPKVIIDSRSHQGPAPGQFPAWPASRPTLARSRARLRPMRSTSTPAGIAPRSAIRLRHRLEFAQKAARHSPG